MLGELDRLVQRFSKATRYKRGIANTSITLATAKCLSHRYPRLNISGIYLTDSWTKSLFQRMGFIRNRATTGKIELPVEVVKETELKFAQQIVNPVEKHNIQPELINSIKLHQSTLKVP